VADVDALVAIEAQAFDPALYAGSTMSRRSFAAHIGAGRNPLYVAVERNAPACGYALGFVRASSLYLRFYSLAILPEHAGRGAGRLLFQAMERFAQVHGSRGMRLEVRADNERLRDRYLGLGYRVVDEVAGYYADGCAAIRMVRDF
jgi:ribosomal protein S18 acetylase RimI-like enzyme